MEYIVACIYVIYLFAGYLYLDNLLKGSSIPTLGMWFIFSIATFLNVISIFSATNGDLISNAYSVVDFLVSSIIFCVLLYKRKDIGMAKYEYYYLIAALIICVFWIITKNPFLTNLLVQLLIVVGYLPTLHKLVKLKRNSEPIKGWILFFVAALLALYPAYVCHNILAIIYASRSILIILLMILLMRMYNRKSSSIAQNYS